MNPIIPPRPEAKEEARRVIRREISGRYEEEKKRSGFWRGLVIAVQIEREVAEEMKRRFPPQALFAADSIR